LNIAFKTIHILGQVLRNFPGDINRIYKKRIAEQCYLLGLRIMSFAMRAISVNADTLRRHFVALLTEKRVEGTATLLGDLATKALLEVAILWVFGIVKTLSQAVGMEELSETYLELLDEHADMLSVQIVDTSIQLDHFGAFPERILQSLHKRVRKNVIAFSAIRRLLLTHYYLYRTDPGVRAKFARLYDIELSAVKNVEGGLVKETSTPRVNSEKRQIGGA
jgi:hypothetical protein